MTTKQYRPGYHAAWIRNRRDTWIKDNGNKCNLCGITNVPFDIDHIDPKQKEHRIAGIWTRCSDIREKELAKCQVLCKPCHKAKTRHEQYKHDLEHGTLTMYKNRGCRCDQCRNANRIRVAMQRARAKEQTNG